MDGNTSRWFVGHWEEKELGILTLRRIVGVEKVIGSIMIMLQ